MAAGLDPDYVTEEEADNLQDAMICEVCAFSSHESARKSGVDVGRNIHQYRPRTGELSLEERRRNVHQIEKKSRCRDCGQIGHWSGDSTCKKRGSGRIAMAAKPFTKKPLPKWKPFERRKFSSVKPRAYIAFEEGTSEEK